MKGHSLPGPHQRQSPAKIIPLIAALAPMVLDKLGDKSPADGKSAATYKINQSPAKAEASATHTNPHPEEKITWGEEKETSNVTTTDEKKGTTSNKKTYKTEGTSKRKSRGRTSTSGPKVKKGDKGYDAYMASRTIPHVKTREELSGTEKSITPIKPLPPKPLPVEPGEPVVPKNRRNRKPKKGSSVITKIGKGIKTHHKKMQYKLSKMGKGSCNTTKGGCF